ncbi:MAG: hypothetical protein V1837_01165 [Candidatus Woesearchaeota archaeon]
MVSKKRITGLLFIVISCSAIALAMNSTNYQIPIMTTDSGGGNSSSTRFTTKGLVGTITGNASSTHYTNRLGIFYSTQQGNHLPNITRMNLTPLSPKTTDNLNCSFKVVDMDADDTLYANFTWYNGSVAKFKGRIAVTNNTLASIRLSAANTTLNDVWNCSITPYDSTDYGTTRSRKVTIVNAPPNVTLIWPNNNNDTTKYNRTLRFLWNGMDADGDQLNYTIKIQCRAASGCAPYLQNLLLNVSTENYTITQELEVDKKYNWTIRAWDGFAWSDWAGAWNFTVASKVAILLTNNATSFGTLNKNEVRNTTKAGDSYNPFVVRNDGNMVTNITIKAISQLWKTVRLNTTYFQFMAGNATTTRNFNWTGSQIIWRNVSDKNRAVIKRLNYSSHKNNATIEFLVRVPLDEGPGTRNSGLIITGVAS